MSREEEIFEELSALPSQQRAGRLDALAGGDSALKARVAALLDANDSAASFMEAPAGEVKRDAGLDSLDNLVGRRIGRYKILQKIGEGGCGIVCMAEQEEPVRRRVALKIIKLGMDTKAVIARFEAERQALSMMEHPNIARVLDAGATESGRPFFAMELVRGIPITRYADENNLDTGQRLALFLDVCAAVQHAHQKGVIHRDLKPSNILVTLHDTVPVPKVIDFGVAKATHGRLTNQTLFTAFEQFIGTPAYMSPEQAELSGLDIDTRSDIYSLGVLLYEMLAGRPPFDPKTFSTAGLDEIRRVIREVEPPTPSARLITLGAGDQSTIAKVRRTAPERLVSVLRGDLDWIVMKALEKNRSRRYDTANGLAVDIRRFLRNEPVLARPPSTAYLAQKLFLRHRVAFVASGIVFASLIVGVTALAARLSTERKLQATQKSTADILSTMFQISGRVAAASDNPAPTRAVLENASAVLRNLDGQPLVKARLLETLGGIAFNIGDLAPAQEKFSEALKLRIANQGPASPDVARARNNTALVASALVTQEQSKQMLSAAPASKPDSRPDPRLVAAAEDLQAAIKIQRASPDLRSDLARSQSNLGWILAQLRQNAESEAALNSAIEYQRSQPGKLDLALSYRRLGLLQVHENQVPAALENLDRARAADREAFPGVDHLEVASDYNFRAVTLAIQDDSTDKLIAQAIESYYEGIRIREKLKSAATADGQTIDATSANLSRQGTLDEVTALVAEARAYAAEHRVPGDELRDSFYLAIPAFVFLAEKDYVRAAEFGRACYLARLAAPGVGSDHWRTLNAESMLGAALMGQRNPDLNAEAGSHLVHAYEGMKRLAPDLGADHQIWVGSAITNLMLFRYLSGNTPEAVRLFAELKAWEARPGLPAKVPELVGKTVAPELRAALEKALSSAKQ